MCRLLLVFLVIVLGSLFCLSGCRGVDIDKRNIVVGLGVDVGKNARYRVTLKIAAHEGGESIGLNDFFILDQEANSIAYAVEALQAKSEKFLDFSQTRIIVMDEVIARNNAESLLDYAVRKPGLQFITWMAVARPNANDLLKVKRKSEKPVGIYFNDLFTNIHGVSMYIDAVSMSKFYARFCERGSDPYLPILEHKGDEIVTERLALFDKKGMKLELVPEEVSLFRLITKKPKVFHYELNGQNENEHVVTQFRNTKVRYNLKEDTQPPKIRYNVRLSGVVEEAGKESVTVSTDASAYASEEAREIQRKLVMLLEKMQNAGLDPLGFGLNYLSKHWNPNENWEAWQTLYPQLKFDADVRVQLRSDGSLK